MDYQALHDAIAADPTALSLVNAGDRAGCAARMSAVLSPIPSRYIPVNTMIYWGALTGVRAKMQKTANDDTSPVQSLAISYMDMIRSANSPGLDTFDPNIVGPGGMLDGFTAAGVFAGDGAGSKAHLLTFAMTPAVVTADDIERAGY
jgi:hypothetical protein